MPDVKTLDPASVAHFADSLHLASAAVGEEPGTVGISLVKVIEANPVRAWVASDANVGRVALRAIVVATVVPSFKTHSGLIPKVE